MRHASTDALQYGQTKRRLALAVQPGRDRHIERERPVVVHGEAHHVVGPGLGDEEDGAIIAPARTLPLA